MGKTKKPGRGSRKQVSFAEKSNKDHTVEDWMNLSREVLLLKCTDNHVERSGKKDALSQRLFDHFHPITPPSPEHVTEDEDDILNRPPPDIIDEDGTPVVSEDGTNVNGDPAHDVNSEQVEQPTLDQEDDANFFPTSDSAHENDGNNPFTQPLHGDDNFSLNHSAPPGIAGMITSAVQAAMSGVMAQMRHERELHDLTSAEVKALRSEVRALKNAQTAPPAPTRSTTQQQRPSNTHHISVPVASSTRPRIPPSHPATATATTADPYPPTPRSWSSSLPTENFAPAPGNNNFPGQPNFSATNTQMQNPTPLHNRSSFRLPPLKKPFLEAIEKGDYVDFDKMKKKPINEKSREETQEGYKVRVTACDSGDDDDGTLRLKKVKSNKVENFPQWLEVWNMFLTARCHYKPEEHPVLFKYQQYVTQFASRYRFESIYAYDIDFRTLHAAERSLPHEDRSALWGTQHEELKHLHLHNQQLPTLKCFNCSETGHVQSRCTKLRKRYNTSQQAQPQQQSRYYSNQPTGYTQSSVPSAPPPPPPPFLPTPTNGGNNSMQNNGPAANSGLCNKFNATGDCFRGRMCKFRHACNRCHQQGHGGVHCLQHTSSGFRPRR